MADRDVTVSLRAQVSGFVAGIRTAQAQVKGFNDDLERSFKKRRALSELGTAAGVMGAAAAAGFGFAVKAAADFDSAMSKVEATGTDAARNLDALRETAMKAGEATAFSATEAAGGIENLLKAGVKAKDVMSGGLAGALDLAAAGEIGVAEAAEIAATAMTQFNLKGKDVPHIADLLAAGAGKAQGEVTDMAMALKQGGLVASNMGLSIEETTGALSAFASAGLLGSDAGTSLKTMLLRLQNPVGKANELMDDLGFSAYDAKGNFIGLEALAGELSTSLEGMTQQQRDATLATLFGSDAVRAATVLYRQGEEGISRWIKKVNDQGYAADAAATKMDNLKGDFEELTGALETALIGTGESAQGPLRDLVQGLTSLIRTYNNMPEPVKKIVSAGLLGTAVLGGGAFVASRVLTGIAAMKENLADLGITAGQSSKKLDGLGDNATKSSRRLSAARTAARGLAGAAGLGLLTMSLQESNTELALFEGAIGGALTGLAVGGPIGAAIGAGAGALTVLATKLLSSGDAAEEAEMSIANYKSTLNEMTGATTRATRAMVAQKFQESGLLDKAELLKISTHDLVLAASGHEGAQRRVNRQLAAAKERLAEMTHRLEQSGAGTNEVTIKTAALTDAINRTEEAIREESGQIRTAVKDNRQLQRAVDGNTDASKRYTSALGRMSETIVDNTVDAAALTGRIRDLERANVRARGEAKLHENQLKQVAERFDLNKQQAQKLIEKYNDIPEDVRTDAIFKDEKARQKVANFVGWTEKQWNKVKTVSPGFFGPDSVHVTGGPGNAGGGGTFRSGGLVTGPGTTTSDSILTRLSNREFVQQATAVEREGVPAMTALNEGRATIIPIPGLARGGRIGDSLALDADTPAVKVLANMKALRELVKSMSFGGRVGAALAFAKHERGDPYELGGVGPGSYDCSGFMSAITNVLRGRPAHSRVGTTATFPWPGFVKGPGVFTIGSTPSYPGSSMGHMAGTLAGINVESSGGVGVRVGPSARGWRDPGFSQVYHLAGVKLTSTATGGDTGALSSFEKRIIRAEAGGLFNTNANNPISSAFGLGQLIEANRVKYARQLGFPVGIERGDTGTTNRDHQIAMMRAYIRDRYGSDRRAWAYHQSHGVYDRGGLLPPGVTMAVNRTGKNEHILTDEQYRSMHGGRYQITITNWSTGEGFMERISRRTARQEVQEEFKYQAGV